MSAEDVAAHFGVDASYIEKFQAPVQAELAHMVDLAKEVPLHFRDEGVETATFGHIIAHRLVNRRATSIRWSSRREQDGRWVVQVSFALDSQEQEASWYFDPKHHQLSPANDEATSLSSAQDLQPVRELPRLRLVDAAAREDAELSASEPRRGPQTSLARRIDSQPPRASRHREDEQQDNGRRPLDATEDLLEALRRHRATNATREHDEAEATASVAESGAAQSASQQPTLEGTEKQEPAQTTPETDARRSRTQRGSQHGRTNMPSWDEIVFGTKGTNS